jgi:hypothetical protein
MHATGATSEMDLLEGLYLGRYTLSPGAVRLVFQTAAEGDAVAQETVRWAGRELGDLALGVIRQLDFQELGFDVVLAGSLYGGSPLLVEAMQETIHAEAPGARLVRLTAPPVVGGVLLGMEQVGIQTLRLRQPLMESTQYLR